MTNLNIDNQVTVTNVTSQVLNVTFSGSRLNILAVAGPMGPSGANGANGTGTSAGITGVFPILYDRGSGVVSILSGYYATFSQLTGASGAIVAQIAGSVAGVSSLNGLTGAITAAGTGAISITIQGQRLIISGSGLASQSDVLALSGWATGTFATQAGLAATGAALYGQITGLSGFDSTTYATKAALQATGQGLYASYTGLSGALGATGQTLGSQLIGLSGLVTGTGAALEAQIVSVASSVASSGQQLYSQLIGLSGLLTGTGAALESQIVAGGAALAATGQALYGQITGFSGVFVSSGAAVQTQITTLTTNLTSTGVQIGATIAATGQQAWTAADTNARTLSGILTQTGVQIEAQLIALSGALIASGGILSAIKVSGSTIIPIADFTGLGGTIVLYSGGRVFISGAGASAVDHGDGINLSGQLQITGSNLYRLITGSSGYIVGLISAASAGVASINGASGVLILQGAGNVSVTTAGQTITVSGNTGDYALFATKLALAQTGTDLLALIRNTSGAADGIYVHRTGAELISGVKTFNDFVNVSTGAGYQMGGQTVFRAFTSFGGTLPYSASTYVGGGIVQSTSASLSTLVGYGAGQILSTGQDNVMVGVNAGALLKSGSFNTVVGDFALGLTPSGDRNVIMGYNAASQMIEGVGNVVIGTSAAVALMTGTNNTLIGDAVAGSLFSGSSNISIGRTTYPFPSYVSNTLNIGQVLFGTGVNVASNVGAIGIGSSNPLAKLHVSGDIRAENGFLSGTTQLSDLLYPRTNPSGYITGSVAGTINGITGASITGTGIITVSTVGNLIIVSGNTGDYALFATKVALTQSGVDILTILNATGAALVTRENGISGVIDARLGLTGSGLYTLITGASGQYVTDFATKAALTSTGVQLGATIALTGSGLYTLMTGMSGTLVTRENGISGVLDGRLALTGSGLYTLITGMSGQAVSDYATRANLALTGQQLYVLITGASGQAVTDYATKVALQSTGQQLATTIALTGSGLYILMTGLSGQAVTDYATKTSLTNTGTLLSAVRVTGSPIISVVNLTGLGGTQVIWSGGTVFISGGVGGGGSVTQGQLDALSGYGGATYATITNLALTGSNLQAQIRALTGLGTSLAFDIGRNIVVPSGTGSFPVTFSRDLGANAFVIPVISNNSGDPTLAYYPSGMTNLGFTLVMSATVPTSGYRLSYLATTGSGFLVLGQSTGTDAVNQSQLDILSGFVIARGNSISGTLDIKIATTGTNLYVLITGMSGQGIIDYATKINLTATGQTLQSRVDLLSGQIIQTGAQLQAIIANTGQQAWTAADANGRALSGALTQTGLAIGLISGALIRAITGPSGQANINGEYIPAQTVLTDYPIRVNDNRIYCNNTNPITLTFVSATVVSGQLIRIKLLNTGFAVLTGTFGQKFDGSDSYVMNGQYLSHEFHSNGSNWCIW